MDLLELEMDLLELEPNLLLEELVPHGEEGHGEAGAEEQDEVGSQLEPGDREYSFGINKYFPQVS